MHGVIGAGVILSVMGGGVFTNVLAAPNAWLLIAGTVGRFEMPVFLWMSATPRLQSKD